MALLAGLARRAATSLFMHQAAAAAVVTAAATTQVAAAAHARCPARGAHSSSRKALQASAAQQAAMAGYWRSILSSARAFGANRPAALLLGTAAVSAGVWAAQVRGPPAAACCWVARRAVPVQQGYMPDQWQALPPLARPPPPPP